MRSGLNCGPYLPWRGRAAWRRMNESETQASGTGVSTPYQFWLIERGPNEGVSQHQWWNEGPDGGVMGWKSSVHEATRYPSKEAAERVVRANRGLCALPTAITSHSFVEQQLEAR